MTAHTADEIIEAMARAMFSYEKACGLIGTTWDTCLKETRKQFLEEARAAYAECLKLLREPTDQQLKVAEWSKYAIAYTAMIDARLKELG